MLRLNKFPAFILALLALAACGPTDKIGSTVKGTRIAIMPEAKSIQADHDLHGQNPDLPQALANRDWPEAGFDTTHAMPNAQIADHPHEIWRANIGSGSDSDYKLLARPVVSDGRVFTMDSQGLVKAFDANSGDKLWEFDTTPPDRDESAIGGGLGVYGGTIYATTGFGEVIALRVTDGLVGWRHLLQNPVRAAPTVAEGRVYAVSIDNQLTALDTRTGVELWHHNGIAESATLMGASNPAVENDSVVVAYSSGELYNLRAQNGRVSWNYALTTPTKVGALPAIADIRGLPVIDNNRVFAISHSGRMVAIDQRTGDRAWETDIGGINTPLVVGDSVFVLSNDNQLLALERNSGRVLWVEQLQQLSEPDDHESDPVYWTGPVMAGARLWLCNSLGQLVSIAPDNGVGIEQIDLDAPAYIPPVVAYGTIYVVTDDGTLVASR